MKRLALALVVISLGAVAQDKPKESSHPLKDVNRFKLVVAFQKSQNLQQQVQVAAMDLCRANAACSQTFLKYQSAVAETNMVADAVAKDEGLPPGTSFSVNTDSSEVSVSIPKSEVKK